MSPAGSVLVVCTANVCRSPSGALLLADQLQQDGGDVRVSTAGTRARPGASFCDVAADLIGAAAVDLREQHRSRAVAREDLLQADLVLVMERRHRSAVVALLPAVGPRAFTLREAAHLAAAAGPRLGEERHLRAVAATLNSLRGTVPTPAAPSPGWRARLSRRPDAHPFDIPDPHTDDHVRHDAVLDQVRASTSRLAELLLPRA